MEVELLKPSGFCFGVSYAIDKIKQVRLENPDTPIYVYGMLIHNKHIIKELFDLNIYTIDKKDDLSKLQKGIMCSTAHGISEAEINHIKENGFEFINATCPIVFKAIDNIKKELDQGYEVLYLGKHNHPETIASCSISDKIHLICEKEDVLNCPNDRKYALTCQTTMTKMELMELYDYLIINGYDVKLLNDVCGTTTLRQKRLIETGKNYDAIFIVGDPKSNNNTKLFNLAKEINPNSYFIQSKDELLNMNITYDKVLVGSGTSTPQKVIDEVINYLESIE